MRQSLKRYWNSGRNEQQSSGRLEMIRYIRWLFLLCFVFGIIAANMFEKNQPVELGIWNTYFVEKFKFAQIQSNELFYYILEERVPVMILFLLFAVTNWGKVTSSLFLMWQSFAAGFMLGNLVVAYGVKGILLGGTALFPHYMLYIPLYVSGIYLASLFRRKDPYKWNADVKSRVGEYLLAFVAILLIMSVFVTGIFLESYINPILLKKILKIF